MESNDVNILVSNLLLSSLALFITLFMSWWLFELVDVVLLSGLSEAAFMMSVMVTSIAATNILFKNNIAHMMHSD